ncbi:3-ketodihydrosphingosine reductase [Contarinia nasturtii]|uniref:3-ketodihydrosphingosine reductase n=1 Tax=Contarinia nasturtii TaxID=265458 RepID=UPI0012D3B08A|nr:3-ketodihydrosphingosine reductase [Contarinia nasturtii]
MDFPIEIALIVALLAIAHIGIYLWVSKKPQRPIQNRHVVVTGGSSGIGFWIAVKCAQLGAHVTIVARNVEKLESALKKIQVHKVNDKQMIQCRSVDLSSNYENVKNALSALEEEIAPIYFLVNCAGGAICGRVDELSPDDAVYLMNINYFSVYYPTRYILTKMKEKGDGIITITGSQASLMGVYGLGPYAVAKFALRGLAETIAMEVSNTKISITLALPADTDTPGFENENLTKPEETKTISGGAGLAKPEDMATVILNDSLIGNFISISGFESWLLTIVCSGMSPWGGLLFTVLQSIILGPLRFVAYGIQWHCRNVVKTCAQKQTSNTSAAKKDE